MSIAMCVLGSGSAGNCTALVLGKGDARRVMLIDAGLSPRMTTRRLAMLGLTVGDVADVLLTHLDGDHFHGGWRAAAHLAAMRWHAHADHARSLQRMGIAAARLRPFRRDVQLDGDWSGTTTIHSIRLPHDERGTAGFVIEHAGQRLGYATDLGHVPASLHEHFTDLDALAIESNYDVAMQLASARPMFLKQRIMGGHGHLSNDQSLEAVLQIDERSRLRHVALLHLSRQCNDPSIIEGLYSVRAPHLAGRLTIASQHAPTPVLRVELPGHLPVTTKPMATIANR